QESQCIGTHHAGGRAGIEPAQAVFQRLRDGRRAFDEQRFRGAARQRLHPERPAAGEQVQHPGAGKHRLQPVEKRLARAVGGRPQARCIRHRQARATPAAADDADLACGALHAHSPRPGDDDAGGNIPPFSPIPGLHGRMVSWFRRDKPESEGAGGRRRLSIEELAAAFPESHQAPPSEAPEAPEAPQAKAPAPETPGQEAPPAPPAEAAAPDAAAPAAPEARAPQQTPPRPAVPATPPVAPPPAPPVGQPPAPPAATPAPAPSAPDEPAQAPAAPGKKGWRERLGVSGFARSLGGLFSNNPRLDDDLLDEIETALLVADVGVAATTGLVETMRKR